MHQIRRNFIERHQDESTLSHSRVRNLKPGLGDLHVTKEQNIEIEGARPIRQARVPVAAKFLLDGKQCREQLLWLQIRFERSCSVDESWLLGKPHRLG